MNPTERRLILRRAGYSPIPVRGKRTYLVKWQEKVNSDEHEIARWAEMHRDHPSTGILTKTVPVLDIDIKNQEAVEGIVNLVRARFADRGRILVRVGQAPKRAIPFRTAVPFNKIVRSVIAPSGASDEKIELLGDGQQLVAFGIHPDTHLPYLWYGGEPGEVAQKHLPELGEIEAQALIDDAIKLLCDEHGYRLHQNHEGKAKRRPKNLEALIENISVGRELHESTRDLAASLVARGVPNDECVTIIRKVMVESPSLKDARYHARLDDIPRMVATASAKFGASSRSTLTDSIPSISEETLALNFAAEHEKHTRFVAVWNRWLLFDGSRWSFDETRRTFDFARKICREASRPGNRELPHVAKASMRAAVLSLASDDRRLAATVDQWDADPWLLNTPTGVVDLRTGSLCAHRAEDYMTKSTAIGPDSSCAFPLFRNFLDKVTRGDVAFQAFLARVCGYALTGITQEHAMFFVHGDGGNGKSVFMGTVTDIMGDYHRTAPIETFTATHGDRHPTELAGLRGARMVTATETEEGRRWNESKIKTLTGGDKISARFMRQDFFEYVPQFKLLISGNHKPALRSVDEAIRRRFHLLPFTVSIPPAERDPELREKLRSEWPGIFAWMLEGCRQWQQIGLSPPDIVTAATNRYLEQEDAIGIWVDDLCERDPNGWSTIGDLFSSWLIWASAHGEYEGSSKRFSMRLESMGFTPDRRAAGRGFRGLKLSITGPFSVMNPNTSSGPR